MNISEMMAGNTKPLELYIHIPFCVKKCEYCDFLSAPSSYEERKAYVEALCQEIQAAEWDLGKRPISTVFIGGGTPSILETELMEPVLQALKRVYRISDETEFTIEANPGTLSEKKLELYRKYGINRISLGLQSTFDDDLKMLGRIHTYREFKESYLLARKAGFENINVDLMSAIPGQTKERWRENLKRVAALEPEHISAYSLIIEEGTPFYEKELELPEEDAEYEMYEETAKILKESGYQQYEISNYARAGRSCRHNIGYWKREDYLGIGLGASSFINGIRFSNTSDRKEYLEKADNPCTMRKEVHTLSRTESMEEYMFLGLRLTEGIRENDFYKTFEEDLMEVYGNILKKYEKTGHLIHTDGSWKFSREGIHVSNWILADFLMET